jgi:hypothetical protein
MFIPRPSMSTQTFALNSSISRPSLATQTNVKETTTIETQTNAPTSNARTGNARTVRIIKTPPKGAAERSRDSYNRNRINVARQRILNSIDNGKCVLRKTLNDPKYAWNDIEKKMMIQCLENRRKRYQINPNDITYIRDHRFRKVYPTDNYKAFHDEQVKELAILEDKLKKLREFVTKLEDDDVSILARHEIKRLEDEIKNKPFKTMKPATGTPRSQPFNSNRENIRSQPQQQSPQRQSPQQQQSQRQSPQQSQQQSQRQSPQQSQRQSPQRQSPQQSQRQSPQQQQSPQQSQRQSPQIIESHDHSSNSMSNVSSNSTKRKDTSRTISSMDVKKTIKFLIKTNKRYINNTKDKKEKGKHNDFLDIDRFFNLLYDKFETENLMDVYEDPDKFMEYTKNNKKFLNLLYVIWNHSKNKNYKRGEVPESIIKLATRIESISSFNMQHGLLKEKSKQKQAKSKETYSYYDWDDIKKIPSIIIVNSVRDLMDLILIRIYVEENVVRDNLGRVFIKIKKQSADFEDNYIYKFNYVEKAIQSNNSDARKQIIKKQNKENQLLNGRYIFILKDYKTSGTYGTITVPFSKDITKLIDKYLIQMQEHLDTNHSEKKLEFLFTKDDGDIYSNGLSSYITEMFRRHTGTKNLGINALRHSVATYFKDQSDEDKLILAQKMHHTLETHKGYERDSGVIDKIPILENLLKEDPFVGKKVYFITNEKREEGVVNHSLAKNRIDKPYKISFLSTSNRDKPYNNVRYFTTQEVEELLAMYNTFKLIGSKVIYTDTNDSNIGKPFDTILEYNKKHRKDKTLPPYSIRIKKKNNIKIIQIQLPNSQIQFI